MSIRSVADIEQELRDNAESIARQCISNGQTEGDYFKAGDVYGGPGDSLVVYLKGARAGLWRHYAGTDSGDMLDLIEKSQGCRNKGEAVAIAKGWLGIEDEWQGGKPPQIDHAERERRAQQLRAMKEQRQQKQATEREAKMRGARALYLARDTRPIAGTPAEAYLTGRGLNGGAAWPGALRFHPEVWNKEQRVKVPAMLAPIYLADGTHVATHRIYLQPCPRRGWTKLDCADAKKVLGPFWGGFVPINKGASGKPMSKMQPDEPVYVTEGIEDAIVVRMIKPDVRIVCAIALGNIGAIILPDTARKLVIVADRDEKPAAIDALERSIAQQQARGLDVHLVMPPVGVKDMNDWLIGQRKGAAA